MNPFNFYNVFDFDDDTPMIAFQVAAAVVAGEESMNQRRRTETRGSVFGHNVVNRNRKKGDLRLHNDYFAENPKFTENQFRMRFRMSRRLFLRIANAVEAHNPYFKQKKDALGVLGFSCLQKVTAAHRILAYGIHADLTDEYIQIGKSTAVESLKAFVKSIVEIFGDWYLRAPNESDIGRLLSIGEHRGFPGMLGSIDCMHWKWEKCPLAWHGMNAGHYREPTIILEAVASQDLWIWHAFFGMPGSLNNINVHDRPPVFATLAEGHTLSVNYTINEHEYTMGYYLAGEIYPNWSTFVKTIPGPLGEKRKCFASKQESARKDVERAFGVLQSRFAIVRGPVRYWDEETLANIMKACIIMHNMIIEDEGAMNLEFDHEREITSSVSVSHVETPELHDFLQSHNRIRDTTMNSQLQDDLVEHLWEQFGN